MKLLGKNNQMIMIVLLLLVLLFSSKKLIGGNGMTPCFVENFLKKYGHKNILRYIRIYQNMLRSTKTY